jgi:DNA-binding transcriptional MerR regulator
MKEYTIRELSEMFGLPASTIRYYEDEGILTNVGRMPSGQRIFTDGHVNRLRTICCFKNTGMTIAELRQFFSYELDEPAHLDDILTLLHQRQDSVTAQIAQLREDYAHVLRKIHYYEDIQESLRRNQPLPQWKDYRQRTYDE